MNEQPNPVKNDSTPIVDLVIEDMEGRKAKGLETYKVLLQAFNGRNAVQDAYEEAMDLTFYLKQVQVEREEMLQFIHNVAFTKNDYFKLLDIQDEAKELLKSLGEL